MNQEIKTIPTRRFGRTEINIPILSLGGMRFQQSWSDLDPQDISQEKQFDVETLLEYAVKHGFHHIETSRHYGTSETQLGWGMQKISDLQRIIQTKIPPKEDPKEFEEELEISFERLKCKKLDLLAIHGLNLPKHFDQTMRSGGCLDVVRKWQANDRIGHVGFSTHAPTDLIVKAIETNQFDYVNLHWYFIFQDNYPALTAAKKLDLGVFIISPTDKGGHLHTPSKKLMDLCSPLHPITFNDLFCLSDQRVHTLSIGASSIQDLSLHIDAVGLLDKANDLLPIIRERLIDSAIEALGQEWFNTWSYGLPTWRNTPGEINIPVLMWLYNLDKSWGMEGYVQTRYRLLGNASHWFPGSNSDKLDDQISESDIRAVLNLSPWADQIILRLRELKDRFKGHPAYRLSSD